LTAHRARLHGIVTQSEVAPKKMRGLSLSLSADPARPEPRPVPGAAPQPVLELQGLIQRFGERTVLEVAAWAVAPGRHSLVLGPSGCGKSTLLHLIAGLLRPTRGRILAAGRDLSALRPAELDRWRGRNIGIVLQNLHLIAAISVRDNLRLARALAGLPDDQARIGQLLGELRLTALAELRPPQLSQGEAQRLAITRAVVNRPALILADEPTSALDDANCAIVLGLLRAQAEASGATLLIATHDARLKEHFAHRLELPARA
jgi:putative ABC transport system ATP-binding protein